MSREDLHLLLERYLTNQCSDEERLFVERLYSLLDKEGLAQADPDELSDLEQKLWNNIHQQSGLTTDYPQRQRPRKIIWYAAAVISAVSLLTAYLFMANQPDPRYLSFQGYSNLVERRNSSAVSMTISLEDGSTVVLQPASSLIYPSHFKPGQREVSLQGEGFFLISKNRKRPFFVYSKNVITRVVGTSFSVITSSNADRTEVIVKTGKVIVVPNQDTDLAMKLLCRENCEAVLIPNQKTVYSPDKGSFETSLVSEPVPVPDLLHQKDTDLFDDTPLPEVVAALQQSYGIEIVIQDQHLLRNTFTGDLSGKGLYKKLDLICSSMEARYTISGTKIIMKQQKITQ